MLRKKPHFTTDEERMDAIRRGDRLAFEQLYDLYFDKLVWFARGFLTDVQQAEDVVQEVFMRIIEEPERFENGRRFSTWIYTLTGNACRNQLRNARNRSRIIEENPDIFEAKHVEMPVPDSDTDFRNQQIREAFESLSDKEKNLFILRFEEEYSIPEIAGLVQIPEGSVKSGLFYLLKKLSTRLKKYVHEF
jgi:RNA polymerase sigma-70 factor (ECF subfamily)